MTQTIHMHVTHEGHRCKKPSIITTPASYIRAGDILEIGDWQVYWHPDARMYRVTDLKTAYDFSNWNCAAAKLVELGK